MEKIINLVQFIGDTEAISIEDGEKLFNEISQNISNGIAVVLDFEGLESCLTRFLNPAIGQLCGRFESVILRKYVKFAAIKPTHLAKLKAVITNAYEFYKDADNYVANIKDVLEGA